MTTTVIGVDPGLVNTGVVMMHFTKTGLFVESDVFLGHEADRAAKYVKLMPKAHVFIEAYRPRGNSYATDPKMQNLMAVFRQLLPEAKVIDNTGVKQVVKSGLMQLMGVWNFTHTSHHQDLRSAARIALFGMLKDPELNELLFHHIDTIPRKVLV